MVPVFSLLLVLVLSLLVTRIATVALVHTGLGREAARFQARSAFAGVGFPSRESEDVAGHPVRRRIVMGLMLIGNIGIVGVIGASLLSFIDMRGGPVAWRSLGVLAGGLSVLLVVARSAWVDRLLSRAISAALNRWTDLDARDYARLLHVREDYGVTELCVEVGDWIAGKRLGEAGVSREGLLVLGVECPGNQFIGAPDDDVEIRAGDRLLLYGRTPRIAELDRRAEGGVGDRGHDEAAREREQIAEVERANAGR